MATIAAVPIDYPPEITGYVEPWIANPGDTVEVKVSCTEPEYSYHTVRVIQGVDLPHSPEKKLEEISAIPRGTAKGRFQLAHSGSYAIVQKWLPQGQADKPDLSLSLFFQAHLIRPGGHTQAIVSTLDVSTNSGFAIVINLRSCIELWVGDGDHVHILPTEFVPVYKRWVSVKLALEGKSVLLSLVPMPFVAEKMPAAVQRQMMLTKPVMLRSECVLLFAASRAAAPTKTSPRETNFFNGRIDTPVIESLHGGVIVQYDFSYNISGDTIIDIAGGGHHGNLVNAPTRGVRGHNWDGHTELDWTKAKYGYGAIHFHEDDLDDAAWATDFSIQIPFDARSGIYAVQVESSKGRETSDMITFLVRTTTETITKTSSKVALVLPTFTYLAYANDKLGDPERSSSGGTGAALCDMAPTPTIDSDRNLRRLDLGLSTYDVHNDGSGNVFSTAKRPIMNLRPGFVSYGLGRPRHISAESIMIGFLEQEGIPYDIVTDEDLHNQGVTSLESYQVVITGGHPEYLTTEVYNAYEDYTKNGGYLMYLGGNGFYWVVGFDPIRPWRLEIRRGESGVRTFSCDPGEWHLSLNGQLGGLWRSQGRSSHALCGVAYCSQGRPPGVPYKRTKDGHDPRYQWMFDGISDGDLIGEHGLGGGASGDEMDSFDVKYGSPLNGVVIATSTGHSDGFGMAPECVTYPILATRGTETREVRSDMVYYDTNAGGAVFSVGSINWYPSLAWDNYNNNVARLTGNVIKEFLRRAGSSKK